MAVGWGEDGEGVLMEAAVVDSKMKSWSSGGSCVFSVAAEEGGGGGGKGEWLKRSAESVGGKTPEVLGCVQLLVSSAAMELCTEQSMDQ